MSFTRVARADGYALHGMNLEQSQARRRADRERRRRAARRRLFVLAGAVVAIVVVVVVVAAGGSGGGSSNAAHNSSAPAVASTSRARHQRLADRASRSAHRHGSTATGTPTGHPGTVHVPVLMYHVIALPPPGAPYPGLYVPAAEFAAQMQALKRAGWHAVTLDQVRAYWRDGVPLGPGKPIVLTFDNGYHSQYTAALPILRRLHWAADENIQLTGLPPSQGGMTRAQVQALVDAGWELDTQGISHADLVDLTPAQLEDQIVSSRRTLRRRFHVPVDWFCYPSGQYDASVIAAVQAAGYVGSTTVVPGWASPTENPFTLPRLRVLGGTSPAALLSQIAAIRDDPAPPGSDESSS
jgi:peptidoglycan/xylan/chitin deacetylase (PgdA/CDA1 family)